MAKITVEMARAIVSLAEEREGIRREILARDARPSLVESALEQLRLAIKYDRRFNEALVELAERQQLRLAEIDAKLATFGVDIA